MTVLGRRVARRWRWLKERVAFRVGLRELHGEFERFRRMEAGNPRGFAMSWEDRYPCLTDRTPETGFDAGYVYHVGWAARKIAERRPARHVDVASSLQFVATLSAFVPTAFYDLRPARLLLPGLGSERGDLLGLPFADGSVESLSCMHVVEHVGLGRYGDPLDPDGDLRAMRELARVVAPGGLLLFVVPVGKPRIQFNAHRVYGFDQVVAGFPDLRLLEFALITDTAREGLLVGAPAALVEAQAYGCGCFAFTRPAR